METHHGGGEGLSEEEGVLLKDGAQPMPIMREKHGVPTGRAPAAASVLQAGVSGRLYLCLLL